MAVTDLAPQPPINPTADRYAAEALARSRAAIAGLRRERDICYGPDPEQRLDLYRPDGDAAGLPTLLFLHGGGWTHGYKDWCGFMAPPLVRGRALFASVGYRLLPRVGYRDAVADAVEALRWAADNIARFGGSPDRLFVGGHSAGGHIAALLALCPERLAAAVKGCFCVSTTFNRRMVNPEAAPDHVPTEPFEAIGPDSPLAHAERAAVPFYITWGGREHERLERTGTQMIAALARAGCRVECQVFPDFDHFDIHLDTGREGNPWTRTVLDWMESTT